MSILIRVLPFWVLGILAGWVFPSLITIRPIWIILVWLVFALLCVFSIVRTSGSIPGVSPCILLFIFFTSFQISLLKSSGGSIPAEKAVSISGRVLKVWEGENSNRIKLLVIGYNADGELYKCREPVLLQTGRSCTQVPGPGDIIATETKLNTIIKKARPEDFPERMYWAGEGVRKKGWINDFVILDMPHQEKLNPLKLAANSQRKLCILLDKSSIGQDQSAIIKAMLLGRKDDLSSEVRDVFQQTGISHLLAVSGLHVGLIYMIFLRMFFFLKSSNRRFLIEGLAVMAVWTYSLMTGFGPSVQRAAGMISLFALSRILSRRVEPLQVLLIAFVLQTALNPHAVFRLGFQLSYLAVAGIFIFYSSWTRLINPRLKLLKRVWDFAGLSIAAQTLTIPFILVYFHQFPLYFIPGNLLLVPLGLVVFYLGAANLVILSFGISLRFVDQILEWIVRLMLGIGEGIAGFPYALLSFDFFSPIHFTGYYILLSLLLFTKGISIFKRMILILSLSLIFSVIGLFVNS